MGLLLRAWDGSCRGRGQVVLIQGEAGLGKSRLVEGLREASGQDRIWVTLRCSPFHTASAFYPIIELSFSAIRGTAMEFIERVIRGALLRRWLARHFRVRSEADLSKIPIYPGA